MPHFRIVRWFLAFSRSYVVKDDHGRAVFRIWGRIHFARIFTVVRLVDSTRLTVREKLLVIDPTYVISRHGSPVAVVRRTTTSGARTDRFIIDLFSEGQAQASGKLFVDDGVTITKGGDFLARIWRNEARIVETLELETTRNFDQTLLLAIALSIVETDPRRGQTSPDAFS